MFKEYDKTIKKILSEDQEGIKWEVVLEDHKSKLAQIQHERLIHLLVTIFVGISMLLCVLTTIITGKPYLLCLDFPLLILFLGYIFHYRYLENTTQTWYKLSDQILSRKRD